jgi:hypothetical protein
MSVARRPFTEVDVAAAVQEIYGVEWTKVSAPACTRIGAASNMTAAVGVGSSVVVNDFDAVYPWASITTVTDSLGNVFVRIPKFYIRKTEGVALKRIEISRIKYPGFYLPKVFWDFTNNVELPYFDYGKHLGSLNGTKLASKPNVFPLVSKNIVEFRGYAQANGTGYQQLDIHARDALAALFTVEFATLNSQAIMQGYTAGQYNAAHTATAAETAANRIIVANATADLFRVGQPIDIGTSRGGRQIATSRLITSIDVVDASNKAIAFDGAAVNVAIGNIVYNVGWKCGFSSGIASASGSLLANDGKSPCAYRGIESPWGDIWQFVDGVNINEYQAWVALSAADYASNVFASPYVQLGYANVGADGYVKEMGYDATYPFAEFPTNVTGGSSTTYYSDYFYRVAGQRIARVGGNWVNGSYAGLRYWALINGSSDAAVDIGGRLLRKAVSS